MGVAPLRDHGIVGRPQYKDRAAAPEMGRRRPSNGRVAATRLRCRLQQDQDAITAPVTWPWLRYTPDHDTVPWLRRRHLVTASSNCLAVKWPRRRRMPVSPLHDHGVKTGKQHQYMVVVPLTQSGHRFMVTPPSRCRGTAVWPRSFHTAVVSLVDHDIVAWPRTTPVRFRA